MMAATCTGPAGYGRLLSVSHSGTAFVERDGVTANHRLHRGCRFKHLGSDPRDPSLMILAFESGPGPDPADATLLASVSPDGLEALARDLLDAVERHRAGGVIDMRFIV